MPNSVGSNRSDAACAEDEDVVSCMMSQSGADDEVDRSYGTAAAGGSAALPATETWLRGNVRPLAGLGLLSVAITGVVGLTVAARGGPSWAVPAVAGLAAAVVAAFALAVARPRLGRRGDVLLVRLAPCRVQEVPLGVVECVFHGSQPLPPARAGSMDRRVGTLVIRLAERATEWKQRPTFTPWGTWDDGHIVIDGRWCEPLSVDLARGIGTRLLEAKREASPGPTP